MKPIIGINLDIEEGKPIRASVQATYYEAIQKAGGIPVLLPPLSDDDLTVILKQLNGLMLIGGRDYCPSLYGESPCEKIELTSERRQEFDFRLLQRALTESTVPVLGICAGAQMLNIALGGSLIQDIPSALPESTVVHSSKNGWKEGFTMHEVKLSPGSNLSKMYSEQEFGVPTSHHQAVKELGKGLKAVAFAHDGIIEAIEHEQRPFTIGVQWHPERDYDRNASLFREFVKHAALTPSACGA